MKLRTLITCDISLLDQRRNSLSLINIIDEINSPSFPIFLPNLSVVSIIEKEQGDPDVIGDCAISITLGDQVILSVPMPIQFQGKSRVRSVADVSGFVIPAAGTLKIAVLHGQNELGTWPIPVNQVGGPAAEVFSAPARAELQPVQPEIPAQDT